MPNAEIIFSKNGYASVLNAALENGYSILPMREAFESNALTMVLRHDVDFSVDLALQMARLEHRLGVRSTFFFMITCDYYNIFSPSSRDALTEISSLGHEVGLHWDSRFLPESKQDQVDFFRAQVKMLSSITGDKIQSASQHIPTDTPAFDIDPFIEINAYSKSMNDRYSYVSDSSMVWRKYTPLDFVAQKVNIQFLAHPIWWMADGSTQADKIRSFVSSSCRQMADCSEVYIDYMKKVLEERELYDEYFRKSQEGR